MTTLPQVLAKGLLADRPTSGIPVGSLYFSTDTVELHQWDGDSWEVYGTAGPEGPAGPAGADGAPGATGPTGATGPAGGMVDPTTTLGDLIVSDGSAPDRLPVGAEGEVPVARAAAPLGIAWEAPASGFANPTTTKGDLIVHDGTDPVRLPVGSNGQVLAADSAQTLGVKWATPSGGGGSAAAGMANLLQDGWQTNYWYGTPESVVSREGGINYATFGVATGKVYYSPFFVPEDVTVDRIGMEVIVAAAGNLTMSIFDSTAAGLPGSRLFANVTVDHGTTGQKEATISQALTGGRWYWTAFSTGATITLRYINTGAIIKRGQTTPGAAGETAVLPQYTETIAAPPTTASASFAVGGTYICRVRAA